MLSGLSGGAYVRLLSAVFISTLIIRVAFGVVVVTLGRALAGDTPTVYGIIVAASPIMELATIVYVGPYVDRHGGKRVLLAGLVMGAIALFGLSATSSAVLLLAFNGLHGVASGSILVPTLAIIAEAAPEAVRGREMGTFNFVNMFGYVLGFGIGFVLLNHFPNNLPITFVLAGVFALFAFVYAYFNITGQWKGIKADQAPSLATFRQVLANRGIRLLTIPWFLLFLFVASVLAFQGRATLPFNGDLIGGAIVVGGVLFVFSQILFGKLSDSFGRGPFLLAGAAGFTVVAYVVLWASIVTGGRTADFEGVILNAWWIILPAVLAALAFPPAGLAALVDAAEKFPKGVVMSVYTLTLSFAFAVSPAMTGAIWQAVGTTGLMAFFALLATGFIGVLLYREKEMRRGALSDRESRSAA